MKHKFLLGLTTTSGSDWRGKIEEAKRFEITEVALFPTPMGFKERQELYKLLEDSPITSIPHVHLRHDFELEEIDYLSERYGTHLFNLHADENGKKGFLKYEKYHNRIYFENHWEINEIFKELIDMSAGICIDFAHWKDNYFYRGFKSYEDFPELLKKYKVGCCHISALRSYATFVPKDNASLRAWHEADGTEELNYMKEFTDYLPEYCSIELENTFEEQLVFKDYLEKLIRQPAD